MNLVKRIPTSTISLTGEPPVSGFRRVRVKTANETGIQFLITQLDGSSEIETKVKADEKSLQLLERVRTQGASTQSIKKKE